MMARTRGANWAKKRDRGAISRPAGGGEGKLAVTPLSLVKAAEVKIQVGNIDAALSIARQALNHSEAGSDDALAALNLLGQIHLELGDVDQARNLFLQAVAIDPNGTKDDETGGGPDKFLSLAQLSEEGGNDSVSWFKQGASALRTQIQPLRERRILSDAQKARLVELTKKLAMTLCAVAELYMTDLSWEADAEQQCETLVTEAAMVAPDFAETWQTLANVRISQERTDDAKSALTRSLALWKDLHPEHPSVPDFPSRVALSRLLMEVGMEEEAIDVLERLVGEDDQSVEVWYLGGWAFFVMGEKQKSSEPKAQDWMASWSSSRVWLHQCSHLFVIHEYEDEQLGQHARELLAAIKKELGEPPAVEEDDGQWEDEEPNDQDMTDYVFNGLLME